MAISIHAPRTGSDLLFECIIPREMSFQSTLPVRGATCTWRTRRGRSKIFQSTLPVRGATIADEAVEMVLKNFNPRSPCGERQLLSEVDMGLGDISIHAPRAGSDRDVVLVYPSIHNFNPRSPCGERPLCAAIFTGPLTISIHAPRAGSDAHIPVPTVHIVAISIHAPRAGSDYSSRGILKPDSDFNPRSPCGERQRRCPKRNRLF